MCIRDRYLPYPGDNGHVFEPRFIYHPGVIAVRFGALGTLTRATEGGENKGGNTASRDNWHRLTLPGNLLQHRITRRCYFRGTLSSSNLHCARVVISRILRCTRGQHCSISTLLARVSTSRRASSSSCFPAGGGLGCARVFSWRRVQNLI